MKSKYFLWLILVGALIAGFLFFNRSRLNKQPSQISKSENPTITADENSFINGYSGKLLAGKNSPFLEFVQADYEKALSSGKIVFLDFYATCCPVCRGEEQELLSGFNSLEANNLVGFRINYNDSDTDENEKKIAKEFGISYQHTNVILKDGVEVLKDGEVWDREKFQEELNKYL